MSRSKSRWDDWVAPDKPAEAEPIADRPEPDPWTLLVPLFPLNPLTPHSRCPHKGPIPQGSAFVCMCCHQAGKDGTRALPLGVRPLPPDLKPAQPDPPKKTRKQRRKDARDARAAAAAPARE